MIWERESSADESALRLGGVISTVSVAEQNGGRRDGTGSLFGQLLSQISRGDFESLVARYGVERYSKAFSCWTQLVAMLFSQLARADSLREIGNGLACSLGKLVHLGVDGSSYEEDERSRRRSSRMSPPDT
jgi:hypothetical protein